MKRRLTLKTEHLTPLSTDELQNVAGAALPDSSYTGRPGCILSYEPCVTFLCTALCK